VVRRSGVLVRVRRIEGGAVEFPTVNGGVYEINLK
jgi:hypothetical protein